MSTENKETVKVYQRKASIYLKTSSVHDNLDMKRANSKREKLENLIKTSFSSLPEHSKILEIGCGEGKNSKYIQNLGFNVTASDVATDFLESANSLGVPSIFLDALEDSFPEKYNGVFCWRVFVHFTKDDALHLIKKVYDNLEEHGIFILNALNRQAKLIDNEWIDFDNEYHLGEKRFYNYFSKETLDYIIAQTSFIIKDFYTEGGNSNNKWLVYVLKKG